MFFILNSLDAFYVTEFNLEKESFNFKKREHKSYGFWNPILQHSDGEKILVQCDDLIMIKLRHTQFNKVTLDKSSIWLGLKDLFEWEKRILPQFIKTILIDNVLLMASCMDIILVNLETKSPSLIYTTREPIRDFLIRGDVLLVIKTTEILEIKKCVDWNSVKGGLKIEPI